MAVHKSPGGKGGGGGQGSGSSHKPRHRTPTIQDPEDYRPPRCPGKGASTAKANSRPCHHSNSQRSNGTKHCATSTRTRPGAAFSPPHHTTMPVMPSPPRFDTHSGLTLLHTPTGLTRAGEPAAKRANTGPAALPSGHILVVSALASSSTIRVSALQMMPPALALAYRSCFLPPPLSRLGGDGI